ncbi:hypothetical protein [Kaistella montana]|uniref:Uncharacterized protein n=1 Tax=Kaistella montana TaxID=1849733 RepID=A0ABW5KC01_9FLAO|nr:hypothetical protein [Kaistella montana]MCQ4035643.1 hypothetical protein [Kaistella montana]
MNKTLLVVLLAIISLYCQAQKVDKYNLGFESQKDEMMLADGWFVVV